MVYYTCLDQAMKRCLQVAQNNCVRFIYGLRKFDHVSSKYPLLKWLKFENLVTYHFLTFTKKLISTGQPEYLSERLIFSFEVHSRHLRNISNLLLPPHSSALFQRSFSYNAVKMFNSLSPCCRNMSLSCFRKHFKQLHYYY